MAKNNDNDNNNNNDNDAKVKDLENALREVADTNGFELLTGKEAEDFMSNIVKGYDKEAHDRQVFETMEAYDGKYKWQEGMSEISGLGGSYEEECRRMLQRGLEWLDHYTEKNPKYMYYENIYGFIEENNADAEELRKVILAAAEEVDPNAGPTGAMYHAVISNILWVKKNGWDRFIEESKKAKIEKDEEYQDSHFEHAVEDEDRIDYND